jgi:ABC-type branched-subunit amino acid transport system substrate-binding protein
MVVLVAASLSWFVVTSLPSFAAAGNADISANTAKPAALADRERFLEIQALYGRSSYSRVLERASAFERDFPSSPRAPEVLNLKGLAFLLTRDAPHAAESFQAALTRAPDALLGDRNWKNYVRYNFAAALLESGKASDAVRELQSIAPESLDAPNRLKYFLLRSRCHEKLGNLREALATWITLDLRRNELRVSPESILSNVERLLAAVDSRAPLLEIEKEAESSSFTDRIQFRSIEFLVQQGKNIEARDQLREFLRNHPTSVKAADAQSLLRGMRQAVVNGDLSIGLLVPMSGRFSRISQKIIQAASLAAGVFGPYPGLKVQLVIEDCGDDAETALRGLERLHSEHKVAAVLGPVLSKGADAVIQRAEELAIPLVSLAQQSGTLGEFSTQAAVTPKMQTAELARHAIEKMGLKRFAILAPKDRFGEEYSREFWSAVEELGGTVTSYETYDPGETDFRKSIDRLSGLFYTDSRKRELIELASARERDRIKKRNRKTEKYFSLVPLVDFDAVFIPDEPKAASLALPTFAYRDIDSMKVLGISAWNSAEFIKRAEKSGEGAVFMDAYFPLAAEAPVRDFSQKFRDTFGVEASSIEAVAFDATSVVATIVASEASASGVDRMKVAARIRQIDDMAGVTGTLSVRDGSWKRELRALTVRNSEVTAWSPSPKAATSAD